MTEYTIALSSVTAASHARDALQNIGVRARITRLLPNMTEKGCAYGVSFTSEREAGQIAALLRREKIRYSEISQMQMKRHNGRG
ncbi:MAG: putative Se/S carrier-like protein [Eubacteriales bacterium]|nr:putative Se/S carrier-like protein [Eubacteriales bacterium]